MYCYAARTTLQRKLHQGLQSRQWQKPAESGRQVCFQRDDCKTRRNPTKHSTRTSSSIASKWVCLRLWELSRCILLAPPPPSNTTTSTLHRRRKSGVCLSPSLTEFSPIWRSVLLAPYLHGVHYTVEAPLFNNTPNAIENGRKLPALLTSVAAAAVRYYVGVVCSIC